MDSELSERRAALRALLVEQAATTARPRVRGYEPEPGRFRMAVVSGAVAVAVVAATVVALQLPGGVLRGAPVGGATPVPAQTSEGPVPTQSAETTPPPVPDPTPTNAPTSDAPVPERTPVAPPTATSTPPAALIVPTGFQRITRAQLHDFVVERGNDPIWEEQAWLDIQCMADHGFVFDPIREYSAPLGWKDGLTAAQQQDYETAMYGPETDQPYDWRTAGCHGLSVHETGQDHAN